MTLACNLRINEPQIKLLYFTLSVWSQVWPLTQCFLFACVKYHWFAWRAYQWSFIGEEIVLFRFSQQLPHLGPLNNFLRTYRNINLTSCIMRLELPRCKNSVRCVMLGNLHKPWLCNHKFYTNPWWKSNIGIELSLWTDLLDCGHHQRSMRQQY